MNAPLLTRVIVTIAATAIAVAMVHYALVGFGFSTATRSEVGLAFDNVSSRAFVVGCYGLGISLFLRLLDRIGKFVKRQHAEEKQ